jgi:ribosomal protein L11 methylase PrmA
MSDEHRSPASFRDPSGFVFRREGVVYRAVAQSYQSNYDKLMSSGLYQALVDEGRLIPHEEVDERRTTNDERRTTNCPDIYKTIRPRLVPFISYPYEWCFSALRDAARLTLAIQKRALDFGQSLKDASAYNVQFLDGKPVFIDTLSFEPYREGEPWVAYRQFCQQFLAPLALMSHTDIRLGQLLRIYIDGVPLDLASRLLPGRTRLSPTLGTHIHLHARSQQHYAARGSQLTANGSRPSAVGRQPLAGLRMSRTSLLGLLSSLESAVNGLNWNPEGTEWAEYYDETNYSPAALEEKARLVGAYLDRLPLTAYRSPLDGSGQQSAVGGQPEIIWDLGANTGRFSLVAANRSAVSRESSLQDCSLLTAHCSRLVVAFDIDPAAVEKAYLQFRQSGEQRILPLLQDFTNPSAGIGWQNSERTGLIERGPADAVLALALIHHLAIGNNLPFSHVADFMARIGRSLIIEFVPKQDSQVQRLLATREDVFPDYGPQAFESAFAVHFDIVEQARVGDSLRTLYLMARREGEKGEG